MFNIGIVNDQQGKIKQLIDQQLDSTRYNCSLIKTTEQLLQSDGIVFCIETKEKIAETIDWLLDCKNKPMFFSWIISSITLEYEEKIFYELGTNGVITKKKISVLPKQIMNIFMRIDTKDSIEVEKYDFQLLNEKNQSIILQDKEILLTNKEFQLLWLLNDNRGNTVNYEQLLELVCSGKSKKDICRVSNYIFHIRKKLNRYDGIKIKTIRCKGYMLTVK